MGQADSRKLVPKLIRYALLMQTESSWNPTWQSGANLLPSWKICSPKVIKTKAVLNWVTRTPPWRTEVIHFYPLILCHSYCADCNSLLLQRFFPPWVHGWEGSRSNAGLPLSTLLQVRVFMTLIFLRWIQFFQPDFEIKVSASQLLLISNILWPHFAHWLGQPETFLHWWPFTRVLIIYLFECHWRSGRQTLRSPGGIYNGSAFAELRWPDPGATGESVAPSY